jgi:DNA-binding beta-propeller fold protein YncE
MDYLAYDRIHHRVWVPAGNTGNVDVVDAASDKISKIDGFVTSEVERNGRKRTVGPSSATVGDGFVYIGNRGDSSVCAIGAESLRKGACVTLDSMPDALAYVSATKEVWATTPRDKSITIIDASMPERLVVKTKMAVEGQPEGFAVDDAHGAFYTNLEDMDRTLTIDVRSRKVTRTWRCGCGEDGPKGLAFDHKLNFLFVACSDRVKVLDAAHDGKELSAIETGAGVDNIDYVEAQHEVYAAAARAARLTVASVNSLGKLTSDVVVPTATGARNPVCVRYGRTCVENAERTATPRGESVAKIWRLCYVPSGGL